jgi:hypothetical protein
VIKVPDFTENGWADPRLAADRARWCCERLEEGAILFFPQSPFVLSEADRNFLLGVRQAGASYYKNISYRPAEDRVKGFDRGRTDAGTLRRILREYSQRVIESASRLLAPYAGRWRIDFASFRPFEEHGRQLSQIARNDLLHVDAFPTRPTNGGRILRVFTNLNRTQPRIWITSDPMEVLAPELARSAGLERFIPRRPWNWKKLQRVIVRWGRRAGLPVRDRSPYDAFMHHFHDFLKLNRAFQEECPKYRWEFPPGSSWIVFTDTVPHAVLSGQFAFEQTFIVPCDALLQPDKAPLRILERLAGTTLTN